MMQFLNAAPPAKKAGAYQLLEPNSGLTVSQREEIFKQTELSAESLKILAMKDSINPETGRPYYINAKIIFGNEALVKKLSDQDIMVIALSSRVLCSIILASPHCENRGEALKQKLSRLLDTLQSMEMMRSPGKV